MVFHQLELKQFRNYQNLSLALPSGVLVFYGANGQGKTNLLEALYVLLRGESFRPSTRSNFLQSGAPALVNATLELHSLKYDLKMVLSEETKSLMINGKKARAQEAARRFPVVLFSPESLAAIKEGPEQRRQLVDDVVLVHSRARDRVIYDFKRCLKTRNKVLRDFKSGHINQEQAHVLLDSLEPIFLPLATELTIARQEALLSLAPDFGNAARAVLESDVEISVDYLISGESALSFSRSDLISAMHKRCRELRAQELLSGASLVGPHRHDIRFLFAGKDSRFFCSQGQQRALILSFKMAQILYHYRVYQFYPFLLLDDVLSELDPVRRTNLINFLREIPSQIFLTTTDLSFSKDFGDRKPTIFRIEQGTVHRE